MVGREKWLESVQEFYVCPTSEPLPTFYFLVCITSILLLRAVLPRLQAFGIELLKVI